MFLNGLKMEFVKGKKIINFNPQRFNFDELITSHIRNIYPKCFDPGEIHKHIPEESMPKDLVKGTHHTYGHDILYAIDSEFRQDLDFEIRDIGFMDLYRDLLLWLKQELFKESIFYQTRPTFRLHYPGLTSNQAGLGVMHTDRDWQHPPEEINFWMPIFNCFNTATLLLEDDFNTQKFNEMSLDFGQLLIFDSGLYHGNQINKEKVSRYSMDFRIIPESNYSENPGRFSQSANLEFTEGNYYTFL